MIQASSFELEQNRLRLNYYTQLKAKTPKSKSLDKWIEIYSERVQKIERLLKKLERAAAAAAAAPVAEVAPARPGLRTAIGKTAVRKSAGKARSRRSSRI